MAHNKQGRIFPRGNVWWISFYGPDPADKTRAKEFRLSTGIKVETDTPPRACVAMLRQYTSKVVSREFVVNADKVTFSTLVSLLGDDYFLNGRRSKAHLYHIKHLEPFFERVLPVNYSPALYKAYQKKRLQEGGSVATVNREMACLNHMLKLAFDSDLLPPVKKGVMLPGEKVRQGFLNPGDFYKILGCMRDGVRQEVAEFLYLSGWRSGKAFEVEWKHLEQGDPSLLNPPSTYTESTKQVGRPLPLTGRLGEIIQARIAARKLDCPYVFHLNGHKIGNFRKAWYNACRNAGYGKILIHDFRRSMANNLDNSGINQKTIMERAGWKTANMFFRYRIGSMQEQVNANEVLENYIEKNKTAKVSKI